MIFSLGLSFAAILLAGAVEAAKQVAIVIAFQLAGSTIASAFRKKPSLAIENRDIGANLSDPMAGLFVPYGTMRIGAHRVYTATTPVDAGNPTGSNYLWMILALCHGPVVGIDEIYLDGHQAFTADGRARDAGGSFPDFTKYAGVWKAYGADGQFQVTPLSTTSHAITGVTNVDRHTLRLHVGSAHGWQVGHVVEVSGSTKVDDGAYNVVAVTSTTLDLFVPQAYDLVGSGGTVRLYTPNLSSLFPQWTTAHEGRGIAFIVLRLKPEPSVFPNLPPQVEVVVRGRAIEDPRTPHVRTITSVSAGPARAHYATTAQVVTSAAHGLAVGDIIRITDAAHSRVNGDQRVDEVIDATTFLCYIPVTTLGVGGTITKLVPSENAALVIRDFLMNRRYGAACEADEIDDAAFTVEADHCDEQVVTALPNEVAFTNERQIVDIAVASGVATLTTHNAHGYEVGEDVRVFGMEGPPAGFNPAGLDGVFEITAVPSSLTIQYACAVSDGTYEPPVVQIPGRDYQSFEEEVQRAWVSVVDEQPRFAISGVVDPTRDPRVTLEEMAASCRGKLIYQSGKFRLFIPRPVSRAMLLDESDIFGEVRITRPSADQLANVVVAAFFNPVQAYQPDTVQYPPPGRPNAFWEDDNFLVLRQSIDLPFCTNRARAQQIAMVVRRASRRGMTLVATVHERCLKLAVGDRVGITHERYGFFEKDFWVDGIGLAMNGQVQLALSEYDETAFDLEADDDTPFIPDAVRPAPAAFVAPTVVAAPAESAATGTLTLTVTDPQHRVTKVEFATATGNNPLSAYTEASGPPYQRTVPLTDKQSSRIAFRVWYLDANGIEVNIGWPVPFTADQSASLATVSVTPVAYSDRIEYQFALGTATTFVEVFSTESGSDPGTAMSVEHSGTHVATLRAGDGRTALNLALAASTNWRVTTFVPYDALNKRGTLQTVKTQGAAPAAPTAISATPTEHVAGRTETQVQIDVVIPNDATITHVRVYRDGIQWGADIAVPAVNVTQRLTHSGLSPGTAYGFKYKTRNASGVVSTAFSPSIVVTTDPGTLDEPENFTAERVGFTSQVEASWDAGANNPDGTLYEIARAPSSGGPFNDPVLSTQELSASFDQGTDEGFFYVVRASAAGWTTSADSNEDEVPAVA